MVGRPGPPEWLARYLPTEPARGLACGKHRFDCRHLCVEIDVTFSDHLKLPIFEIIPIRKSFFASMHDDIALVDKFADLRAKQRDHVRHPNIYDPRGVCQIDFKTVQEPADVSRFVLDFTGHPPIRRKQLYRRPFWIHRDCR